MAPIDWPLGPIAHRGLHDVSRGIVENTATAIARALERGFAVEVDLQRAADDQPVVFHDYELDRLTTSTGAVRAHGAPDLKRFSMKLTADRILGLGELLELVGGRAPLYLEVKSDWLGEGAFEARIAELILPYKGPLAVMSFDPRTVKAFAALAPAIPRGLIAGRTRGPLRAGLGVLERLALRHLLYAPVARPDFLSYDIDRLPAIAPIVGRKLLGVPLIVWTVRTPEQCARAARWADTFIFEGLEPMAAPKCALAGKEEST